jgi:AraC-like DNA-binding protein
VFFVGLTSVALIAILLALLGEHGIEQYLNPDGAPVPAARIDRTPSAEPDTAAAVAELERLMTEEGVYRQAGLSVASLAAQLRMPEYRLRRLIHEQLAYRNFNVFLHHYRIGEACELLRDPEQRRLPILTIALSIGYQSINTFNRGFRELTGVTPSAYRAGAADSGANGGSESLFTKKESLSTKQESLSTKKESLPRS